LNGIYSRPILADHIYPAIAIDVPGRSVWTDPTSQPARTKLRRDDPLRHNGTNRNRNALKVRKSYCFSKDWDVHNAMNHFTMYSYNFCWPVRTLRVRYQNDQWLLSTPAMVAGLTDHIWSLREWLSYPAVQLA